MSEKKKFFYPISLEELLNLRPTSIKKEKETEFDQRRSNMEKDALKEEKLRLERERSQKFLESEFDFKGEDEEISIRKLEAPSDLMFKSSTKVRRALDQSFSMVGYAHIPQTLREFFKIKKGEKPIETDSIEYIKLDKVSHPASYKYAKNYKIRKVESNIKNLYDISMNSLLTAAEITKRAEIIAKLYMKYNHEEEKYQQNIEEEEKKITQKKYDRFMPKISSKQSKQDNKSLPGSQTGELMSASKSEDPTVVQQAVNFLPPPKISLLPPNPAILQNKTSLLPPPKIDLTKATSQKK